MSNESEKATKEVVNSSGKVHMGLKEAFLKSLVPALITGYVVYKITSKIKTGLLNLKLNLLHGAEKTRRRKIKYGFHGFFGFIFSRSTSHKDKIKRLYEGILIDPVKDVRHFWSIYTGKKYKVDNKIKNNINTELESAEKRLNRLKSRFDTKLNDVFEDKTRRTMNRLEGNKMMIETRAAYDEFKYRNRLGDYKKKDIEADLDTTKKSDLNEKLNNYIHELNSQIELNKQDQDKIRDEIANTSDPKVTFKLEKELFKLQSEEAKLINKRDLSYRKINEYNLAIVSNDRKRNLISRLLKGEEVKKIDKDKKSDRVLRKVDVELFKVDPELVTLEKINYLGKLAITIYHGQEEIFGQIANGNKSILETVLNGFESQIIYWEGSKEAQDLVYKSLYEKITDINNTVVETNTVSLKEMLEAQSESVKAQESFEERMTDQLNESGMRSIMAMQDMAASYFPRALGIWAFGLTQVVNTLRLMLTGKSEPKPGEKSIIGQLFDGFGDIFTSFFAGSEGRDPEVDKLPFFKRIQVYMARMLGGDDYTSFIRPDGSLYFKYNKPPKDGIDPGELSFFAVILDSIKNQGFKKVWKNISEPLGQRLGALLNILNYMGKATAGLVRRYIKPFKSNEETAREYNDIISASKDVMRLVMKNPDTDISNLTNMIDLFNQGINIKYENPREKLKKQGYTEEQIANMSDEEIASKALESSHDAIYKSMIDKKGRLDLKSKKFDAYNKQVEVLQSRVEDAIVELYKNKNKGKNWFRRSSLSTEELFRGLLDNGMIGSLENPKGVGFHPVDDQYLTLLKAALIKVAKDGNVDSLVDNYGYDGYDSPMDAFRKFARTGKFEKTSIDGYTVGSYGDYTPNFKYEIPDWFNTDKYSESVYKSSIEPLVNKIKKEDEEAAKKDAEEAAKKAEEEKAQEELKQQREYEKVVKLNKEKYHNMGWEVSEGKTLTRDQALERRRAIESGKRLNWNDKQLLGVAVPKLNTSAVTESPPENGNKNLEDIAEATLAAVAGVAEAVGETNKNVVNGTATQAASSQAASVAQSKANARMQHESGIRPLPVSSGRRHN